MFIFYQIKPVYDIIGFLNMVVNLERATGRFIPETVIGISCNNVQAHPDKNPAVLGRAMTPYFKGSKLQ